MSPCYRTYSLPSGIQGKREFAEWSHLVPLVLVAANYAPFTNAPRPTGNVLRIGPFTESTHLHRVAKSRLIDMYVKAD